MHARHVPTAGVVRLGSGQLLLAGARAQLGLPAELWDFHVCLTLGRHCIALQVSKVPASLCSACNRIVSIDDNEAEWTEIAERPLRTLLV